MANVSAEVNAVLDHAERVNEVAERYKAEAERNRIEAEKARAELARERSRRDYEDPRAYEVAERYARLTEDSLRVLHNERAARLRAEELRMSPPVVAMPQPIEYIPAPVQITAAPVHVAPMAVATAPPNTDGYRIADLEHLLRAERDKVTFLMLEKDRLENLLEAEKQRHEYEKDIMTDELEYRGQEKRYWQWWSSEERQELAGAKSTAEQLRAEADRMRMDLLAEREARQRAERALEEHRLVADRTTAELEQRITRSAEDMVNNYRRVIDTLEKQLEVYRRQAMENEVKMRELTLRADWGRVRQEPEIAATSVTSYSHVASSLAPGKETTSVSQYVRAESPVRSAPPPPLLSASIGNNGSSYFADQLQQLRRERDEAYSALARYEDPIIRTNDHLLSSSSISRPMGGAYSPPRLGSPRRRFEEMSRRVTRLSPTKY